MFKQIKMNKIHMKIMKYNYECFRKYSYTFLQNINNESFGDIKSYSEIPGPKPIPILGNTWRFIPYIGTINNN